MGEGVDGYCSLSELPYPYDKHRGVQFQYQRADRALVRRAALGMGITKGGAVRVYGPCRAVLSPYVRRVYRFEARHAERRQFERCVLETGHKVVKTVA